MTGRKTLGEVRDELEAALGTGPTGGGAVAESLRRFLAGGAGASNVPDSAPQPTPTTGRTSEASGPTHAAGAVDPGR